MTSAACVTQPVECSLHLSVQLHLEPTVLLSLGSTLTATGKFPQLSLCLLCDKTFPGEDGNTCLLNPDSQSRTDQGVDATQVPLGEPCVLLGLLTGIWVRGYLQEQQ